MAPKPKLTAEASTQSRPARERRGREQKPQADAGATRDAVREVVRRYRETFERLSR